MAAASLRISYDEIYKISQVNNKYFSSIVEIQEQELYRSDNIIQGKEEELRKLRESWWEKHKLSVGIVTGTLLGIALSVSSGEIWAKIKE